MRSIGSDRALLDDERAARRSKCLGKGPNRVSDERKVRSSMKTYRKSSRIIGVGAALLVVLAASALAVASPASAAITYLLAEWLGNAVALSSTVLGEAVGTLLFEDLEVTAAGKLAVAVVCSLILEGDYGVNGADDFTEDLTLEDVEVGLGALVGNSLQCTKETLCEDADGWAVNLPWLTLAELWEEGAEMGFVDLVLNGGKGNPGWYIECTVLGVKAQDECTASELAAQITNTDPPEADFTEAITLLFGAKLAICTGSTNKETGVIQGAFMLTLSVGGPLTASE